jgi:ATP-dependent DNA helicase RecG
VDIPDATIIVVAAAERYGLAQLHQLRGRVGRGETRSRCCLIVSSGTGQAARERLEALTHVFSGAEVAELDLRARGPGDLFGTRQSGTLPLRYVGFINDLKLIEHAGDLAEEWLARDPELTALESAIAARKINKLIALGFSLADIG